VTASVASRDTAADVAVAVTELARSYGDVKALDGISCTVGRGEIFGFIGPDGAGKTTLFRILATLIVPDLGTATVLGLDAVRDMWAIRRRLGYMPGRFSLYPDLSVRENLEFFASVFGTTIAAERERIAPIWSQLERFGNRRAAALSGGMKQKLALCCALVHRPDLLLLDEPTTGVDAVSRREFWDLLGDLRQGGLTVVVSTPYMDEAARCDRVALIDRGRLLGIDTPAAIAASYPRPLYGVRVTDRHRAILALRRYPHVHTIYPFGDVLHYTDRRAAITPDALEHELAGYLAQEGIPGATVVPIAPSIEDTFMDRMGTPALGATAA